MFGEPDEDLEDAEILDWRKVGGKLIPGRDRDRDVRPGWCMDSRHVLLGIDIIILADSRACFFTLFEARWRLVDFDTQEFFVGIVWESCISVCDEIRERSHHI